MTKKTAEQLRLEAQFPEGEGWKKWGPYLSERQWGTVREDYSPHGNAWDYFPHDHARSRAYRWGEDGIGGICDRKQRVCFALALWNRHDPILKERLFGVTGTEGTGEGATVCPGETGARILPHKEQYRAVAGLFVPHFGHAIPDRDMPPVSHLMRREKKGLLDY